MADNRSSVSGTGVVDRSFQALFIFLAWTMGVLLFCQAVIRAYGQTAFLALLILATMVCLRLKNWLARLAAIIFTFALLPALLTYIWNNTSPALICLVLILLSVGAYFIRERRRERKMTPVKTQGAERTPVFPPEDKAE